MWRSVTLLPVPDGAEDAENLAAADLQVDAAPGRRGRE